MTTVFYRKKGHWPHPQIDFGDGYDYVVDSYYLSTCASSWAEHGLNQTVLANGYDQSVGDVHISRLEHS